MTTMNPVSLSVAPVIKEAQMPKDMLEDFLGFAEEAISVGMTDQAISTAVKANMTEKFPGTWHVFVGRNFGASITYQEENAAYVYFGQRGVLCFRTP